ncbi:hypothetical protein NG831_06410 [Xanthomonas sacchari]|uniref:hypothetical protein n=1 Tax=Xanthomonas sacchari TaxID=56458 RepID=UPI00225934AC|nr:hypothetical protein [Xanthomonas sacchari]UYK67792.1 hypothetical protein NG831_06410 [Xanthomonas sacchari]
MDKVNLSRREFAPLRELAEQLGVTVEEAAVAAAKEGLELMFRLPTSQPQVLNLQGLKKADKGKQDG